MMMIGFLLGVLLGTSVGGLVVWSEMSRRREEERGRIIRRLLEQRINVDWQGVGLERRQEPRALRVIH